MQQDYVTLLPKREKQRFDNSNRQWTRCKFFTNFYQVQIDPKRNMIYQYSTQIEGIPDDSSEFYHKAYRSIKSKLREKIGFLIGKGQMIWGLKKSQVALKEKCQFFEDQQKKNKVKCQILIRQSKQLNIRELIDSEESRTQILQILNIDMKNKLKMAGMFELGKQGQYYRKGQHEDLKHQEQLQKYGLSVIRGFKFTLIPVHKDIYLQVDTCSRVLQSDNLVEIFNGKPHDYNKEKFEGTSVITKYGTYRTFRIQEIDYSKNPKTKFFHQKLGVEISYEAYYKKAYMLECGNNRQPLLKVVGRIKKQIKKNGTVEEIPEYIYLIPEFVSPTGMTQEQRSKHQIMKQLAPFTKLNPQERAEDCQDMIKQFNSAKDGLIKIGHPKKMNGNILDPPKLKVGSGQVIPDDRGTMKFRNKMKSVQKIKDWLFVYSLGRHPENDDQEADRAFNLLNKAGQVYGIKMKQPGYLVFKSRSVEDWKKEIESDIKQNGKPQLIVCFFNKHEEGYYGELKNFLSKMQITSQMIRRKTLNHPKGAMSAASKIVIQINAKTGGVPWQVETAHPYFKNKTMMYGALSLSKGKKGFSLAFVGTLNKNCTKVYSECKVGLKKKEQIPPDIFQNIYINWAKSFYKSNKTVPELVMIYREGMTEAQAQIQLHPQIHALETMVAKIGNRTKTKNYDPELVYILVNKKINARFYSFPENNRQDRGEKYIPKLRNPPSGSVIVSQMSKDDAFDFHLAAQYVNQGTCTPTYYRIAYQRSKISQEAFMSFTYEQCFNYYNWEGAVRVPACLQCANKLSKLAGEYIKDDITEGQLCKKLHFL